MTKIAFLLGAGFSKSAGLPLASEINERFQRTPLKDHLLHFGSGEWGWSDIATDVDRHNGRIHYKRLYLISFLLDEILSEYYKQVSSTEFNYEGYIQWIYDVVIRMPELFELIKKRIQDKIELELPDRDLEVEDVPKSEIISCVLHLVHDLLCRDKKSHVIYDAYKPYLDVVADVENEIYIYSLNHDLVIESFLNYLQIEFSDGFSNVNSELWYNDNQLSIFDNEFSKRVKLFKLHGSINYYAFQYLEDSNKGMILDYFKTDSYHAKQGVMHQNHGVVIQNVNWNIVPQFVTGTNKELRIKGDKMFSSTFRHFQSNLQNVDKLVVVGYSFSDDHINPILTQSATLIPQIINVNPTKAMFGRNVVNINPIIEQVKI